MKNQSRFIDYLKKNAVYLIVAFCILAIGLSLTMFFLEKDNLTSSNNDIPVDTPIEETPGEVDELVITFVMPVEKTTSILEYSDSMVFNETLGRYSAHMATDFFAEEGTAVLAVFNGKIESIEETLLYGTTVTIDHGDGLKTIYNSIETDENQIFVGKVVKTGEEIGTVSTTNRQEYKSGAHLHFEVKEDGEKINPSKYLTIEEK